MKKDTKYNILTMFVVFLFTLVWFSQNTHLVLNTETQNDTHSPSVLINNVVFLVDIVDTDAKRQKGLSGRDFLEAGRGMLFVFEESSRVGIWMKDMLFPIDIIWFDENLRIVGIKENALPESYPEVFFPEQDAQYVLEVSAGEVQKNKIQISDIMKIQL